MLEKLNPFKRSKKEKIMNFLKTPIGVITLLLILVVGASASIKIINKEEVIEKETPKKIKQVNAIILDSSSDDSSFIETLGVIKAESKIDIIATTRGTVKGIFFEVGDEVSINTPLISLYDNATLTSLNNAQMNFANMQSNLGATERITNESINQAETGVKAAQESVKAAEIALASTEDNLNNGKVLREKSNQDTKNNAIVSFNGYLNTILSSLNEVDSLIINENNFYPTDTERLLGAKKPETIAKTKTDYVEAKAQYDRLSALYLTTENITSQMTDIVTALATTQSMINSMLQTLDNTVTDLSFTDAMLTAQKSNFIGLRTSVVNSQVSAENVLRNLENLDLITKQEIDNLENAVLSAENQLEIAKTNYNNALISLENTKKGKEQQIISSQTSLDSARGQLNLAQAQTADLNLRAPISGQITKKMIELGTEVSPGQVLAEIQQAKTVKIEVNLPSEDIYRIEKEQMVGVGDGLEAMISSIAPAADLVTRKVKVEIVYNNENNDLIPGTFVDVKIPTKALERTNETSIYIPLRAVTITQNESFVFIVDGEKAKKVLIETGKAEGAMIEIVSGLNPQDKLITDGGKNLEDGEKIEILK